LTKFAAAHHFVNQGSVETRVFSVEMTDLVALDVDRYSVLVVRIVEFGDKRGRNTLTVTAFGLAATDFL
jgi:uncharacterized cupin superfamily protein